MIYYQFDLNLTTNKSLNRKLACSPVQLLICFKKIIFLNFVFNFDKQYLRNFSYVLTTGKW